MENEVWSEISAFLNNLRCGDVSRKSYLHFPELEEAEKIRKVKKANFETEMRKLNAEQRQQIENYLEAVQHLAFMEEERAYCQGYVDCIPFCFLLFRSRCTLTISYFSCRTQKTVELCDGYAMTACVWYFATSWRKVAGH